MIVVLLRTATPVAVLPPRLTVAPAPKFVPVIVTAVPPAVEPVFGDTLLTVGAGDVWPVVSPPCHAEKVNDGVNASMPTSPLA
jgi:hypothetical protein